MIDGITNAGSIPALERLVQFTGVRHGLIANNVANLSTPNYRPTDISVEGFQSQMAEAIDARREQYGHGGGGLTPDDSSQVKFRRTGLDVRPEPLGENLLFHDRNDRDTERTMQSLVENFTTFRFGTEMLRNRFDLMNIAIRERI